MSSCIWGGASRRRVVSPPTPPPPPPPGDGGWSYGNQDGREWKLNSAPLEKQQALLTTEPSLQPCPHPCNCLKHPPVVVIHLIFLCFIHKPFLLHSRFDLMTHQKLSYYVFLGEEEVEPGTGSTSKSSQGCSAASSPTLAQFSRSRCKTGKQTASVEQTAWQRFFHIQEVSLISSNSISLVSEPGPSTTIRSLQA